MMGVFYHSLATFQAACEVEYLWSIVSSHVSSNGFEQHFLNFLRLPQGHLSFGFGMLGLGVDVYSLSRVSFVGVLIDR